APGPSRPDGRSYLRDLAQARKRHSRAGRASVSKARSEEHTSELQSLTNLVCRLLLEKKKKKKKQTPVRPNEKMMKPVDQHLTTSPPPYLTPPMSSLCSLIPALLSPFFFYNHTAPPHIYTLSLHDALPI